MISGTAAFSAAVRAGSRLYCWNTNPTFALRNAVFRRPLIRVSGWPRTVASPVVASSSPQMIEISVVFPQPDGPTSRVICP